VVTVAFFFPCGPIVASGADRSRSFRGRLRTRFDDDPPLARPIRPSPGCRTSATSRSARSAPWRVHRLVDGSGFGLAGASFLASVTASSVCPTESPAARSSSRVRLPPDSSDQRARACPADSTPGGYPPLHGEGQLQHPDSVGDDRPTATDATGQLPRAHLALVEHLPIGSRSLRAGLSVRVDVFSTSLAEHRSSRGRRTIDGIVSSPARWRTRNRRSPITISYCRSEFFPDQDRLHQAELADRCSARRARFLVEHLGGALSGRLDRRDRHFTVDAAGDSPPSRCPRRELLCSKRLDRRYGRPLWDERCESSSEAPLASADSFTSI